MNPIAIVFWSFTTCIGFLFSETLFGAVAGLAVGLFITLMAAVVTNK